MHPQTQFEQVLGSVSLVLPAANDATCQFAQQPGLASVVVGNTLLHSRLVRIPESCINSSSQQILLPFMHRTTKGECRCPPLGTRFTLNRDGELDEISGQEPEKLTLLTFGPGRLRPQRRYCLDLPIEVLELIELGLHHSRSSVGWGDLEPIGPSGANGRTGEWRPLTAGSQSRSPTCSLPAGHESKASCETWPVSHQNAQRSTPGSP